MEPVEDGQGHGDVGDDGPGPVSAVELDLDGVGVRPVRLEGVDGPHGEVADEQEGHHFAAGLPPHLVGAVGKPDRRRKV